MAALPYSTARVRGPERGRERRIELDPADHARRQGENDPVGDELGSAGANDRRIRTPGDPFDRGREVDDGAESCCERERHALVAARNARADLVRVGCEPGELGCRHPLGSSGGRYLESGGDRLSGAGIERQAGEDIRSRRPWLDGGQSGGDRRDGVVQGRG